MLACLPEMDYICGYKLKNNGTMRKVLLFIALLALVSCSEKNQKHDQGGENACQYIREKFPELREDIQSVDVVYDDSVMVLLYKTLDIYEEQHKCFDNKITIKQLRAYRDSMQNIYFDVMRSWVMDKKDNDSLRHLSKYKGLWRKAYLIEVTMKSSKTSQYRVSMDEDGTTPSMTSDEFYKSSESFYKALDDLIY